MPSRFSLDCSAGHSCFRLNLVAREADRAQQISNLSTLRVSIETSQTEHQRRMLDLNFAVAQADKQYTRNGTLAKSGVIAAVTLEESQDRLAQQGQALEDEKTRAVIEMRTKRDSVRQMELAVERLDGGLKVVNDAIEGLAVRAPIAGRQRMLRWGDGTVVPMAMAPSASYAMRRGRTPVRLMREHRWRARCISKGARRVRRGASRNPSPCGLVGAGCPLSAMERRVGWIWGAILSN